MSVKKIQRRKQTHVSSKMKHVPKIKHTERNGTPLTKEAKNPAKVQKKALVIAHEIKFAKLLAGNDKKVRDKVLKNLKKWLAIRSESSFAFVEQDFMRLWKGLYYCMWMSDKPLIQEELAESLSKLVHCFNNKEAALLYTKCTLSTLASEWFGIDQHRLDKFQMLVRRIIRQTFAMCKKRSWDREWVDGVEKTIENLLSDSKTAIGFSLHVTELYMEELSKVSGGDIPEEIVAELVRPFAIQLAGMNDERQIRHVMKHIFRYLLFQSNVGLDYVEKFEAWRHAGFPKGDIESMQKVEIDEEDEADDDSSEETDPESENHDQINKAEEKPLDPRAGRVDVELPQLPFDAKAIADLVMTYRFHPSSTTKTRRQILRIAKEFNELSEGKMPLGIKQVKLREGSKAETNPKSAALRLLQFEKELYSDTIRSKRKKKTSQKEEEELDSDADFVPIKKKMKSEPAKKRNDDKTQAIDDAAKREGNKVKSKAIDQSKKKRGNFESIDKDAAEIVGKSSKRKQKKILKKKLNGEVGTDLVEHEALQSLKQNKTLKQKQMNGDYNLENVELFTPVKKSGGESSAKKVKRDSSDGNWCISENVSPISPSRQNLMIPIPSLQDNSYSVVQLPSNSTTSWLTPVKTKESSTKKMSLEISKSKFVTPEAQIIKESSSSSSKKKVKIVLQRNTSQHTSEYMRQLRQSPAIPFDANRKPPVGVLKPSPIPSPVNPFYKRGFK